MTERRANSCVLPIPGAEGRRKKPSRLVNGWKWEVEKDQIHSVSRTPGKDSTNFRDGSH